MQKRNPFAQAQVVMLTLAAIQEAMAAFEQGETNAYDTFEAIREAVATCQETGRPNREAA